MKHPLSDHRPVLVNQIMNTDAARESELNGLPDCILGIILIDIVINNPQAPLDIGDQIPVRLDKVITEQACYPPYIVPGALEDN